MYSLHPITDDNFYLKKKNYSKLYDDFQKW